MKPIPVLVVGFDEIHVAYPRAWAKSNRVATVGFRFPFQAMTTCWLKFAVGKFRSTRNLGQGSYAVPAPLSASAVDCRTQPARTRRAVDRKRQPDALSCLTRQTVVSEAPLP